MITSATRGDCCLLLGNILGTSNLVMLFFDVIGMLCACCFELLVRNTEGRIIARPLSRSPLRDRT